MEQYIDQELTIQQFFKQHQITSPLLSQLKREFGVIKHPTFIMNNLLQIIQHKKHLTCIEAPKQSGRTMSCLLIILDQFLKSLDHFTPDEENGYYLLITSASREQSTHCKSIVQKLLDNYPQEIALLDINSQFPLNAKNDNYNIVLPPVTQPSILFATYYSVSKLKTSGKVDNKCFQFALFDDCNLATLYGGQFQLETISKWISKNQFTIYVGDEKLIEVILGKAITVAKIEEDQEEQEQEQEDRTIQQTKNELPNLFYYFYSDFTQQQIVLYITLKLNLVQGKTLIIVQNLFEIYYLQLLFQRCNIERYQIYNHENPKTLKYYTLSTFNTGVIQILIATANVFLDLENEFFERTKQVSKKSKQPYTLKKLDNIILYNLLPNELPDQILKSVTNTVCIASNNEQNVETVMQFVNAEYNNVNCKEYPIKQNEIEAFRYRIEDTTKNISKYQVKMAEQIDFKKKMVKSPDLVEYFQQNQKEKELLQDQIVQLKKKLNRSSIQLPQGPVPEYLLPEFIKKQRKMQGDQQKVKVLVRVHDQNTDKLIKKRRLLNDEMNNNMLPEQEEKAKAKKPENQYVTINQEDEDPELVDSSRLRPISGKKIWKLKHGFKLKKRNKRLEKKGVFTT
ncbi:unnamed protein product [Paramecium pentaurelia]|uniref:Uncharacterized protein n=1 Tax=Paramecium pentaurelia TaxID=43138 RepID=A0A8S1TX48_9CILI|nr:unnamed protein product [Paramecium pentaurelia]